MQGRKLRRNKRWLKGRAVWREYLGTGGAGYIGSHAVQGRWPAAGIAPSLLTSGSPAGRDAVEDSPFVTRVIC